jgi:ribonuclease BN (tRNA processing enzyme)
VSRVVFVGTSDAFGAGGRRQSAIVLRGPRGTALLDCGGTTATGLAELGISRDEIDAIAISHFHGDHFGGLPLLLLACLYEDARTRPLVIGGPPRVEQRVRELARVMGHPLDGRAWGFPLSFRELRPGAGVELGPVSVRAFETVHNPDATPQGYVLDTGRERVVYSGDTGWFDALPHHARGAHLFICECTFHRPLAGFEFHLSHEELAARRGEFDCGRMILTHLGEQMAERRGACAFETADDGLALEL